VQSVFSNVLKCDGKGILVLLHAHSVWSCVACSFTEAANELIIQHQKSKRSERSKVAIIRPLNLQLISRVTPYQITLSRGPPMALYRAMAPACMTSTNCMHIAPSSNPSAINTLDHLVVASGAPIFLLHYIAFNLID
jgi:hypothetical protein